MLILGDMEGAEQHPLQTAALLGKAFLLLLLAPDMAGLQRLLAVMHPQLMDGELIRQQVTITSLLGRHQAILSASMLKLHLRFNQIYRGGLTALL